MVDLPDDASLSHYRVLGADSSADYEEIRSKYRSLVLAWHPDKFSAISFNHEDAEVQNLADEDYRLSLGSSGNSHRTIRELSWEHIASVSSGGQLTEPNQFLRVQKAWEILRDSESRAIYDKFLSVQRLAHQREESTKVIGEEVCIQDMELIEGKEGQGGEYTYPCRCGDLFVVFRDEVYEAGYKERNCPSGITETGNISEKSKVHRENGDQWQRHSLVLPCQSCSLHIRLHLDLQFA